MSEEAQDLSRSFETAADKNADQEKGTGRARAKDKSISGSRRLDKTPYLGRNTEGQDPTGVQIRAFLADTTMPLSLKAAMEGKYEKLAKQNTHLHGEQKENWIKDQIDHSFTELQTTPTMMRLRGKAKSLSERYEQIAAKGYASADSYFMREAAKLHEQMEKYAQDHEKYKWGATTVDPFNADTSETIHQIKSEREKVLKIQREKNPDRDFTKIDITLKLPEETKANAGIGWGDHEKISLGINNSDKITSLSLDELNTEGSFCVSPDELAQTYNAGAELTPAQIQLLKNLGYIESLPPGHQEDNQATTITPDTLEPGQTLFLDVPELFVRTLPQDLVEKIQGKAGGDSYITGKHDLRGVQINTHVHDYGGSQTTINLDTRQLADEEVYQLVGHYIDTVKAFSRVPKVKS